MHLFAAQPGGFVEDEGIVDLEQTPADIVILSAADSSLSALASAVELLPVEGPSVRLANWMHLLKPAAFDLYEDKVLSGCSIVIVSLLGGQGYWEYGVEQLQAWAQRESRKSPRQVIFVPGDDTADPELLTASTASVDQCNMIWRYLREGGINNSQSLLSYIQQQFMGTSHLTQAQSPKPLPRSLLYWPQSEMTECFEQWKKEAQPVEKNVCALLFYRSHLQSANTSMFDALIERLLLMGLQPLPIAVASLKEAAVMQRVNRWIEESGVSIILNTTGFACNRVSAPELSNNPSDFLSPFGCNIPVLQLMLASTTEADWESYSQGLRSRDIAMQVVLPEMDGRVITRAISFKTESHYSERTQMSVVRYELHEERADFVATLAKRYCELAEKNNKSKKLAIIMANYPTKDGRIGNGVGLDTPASTVTILQALQQAGYPVSNIPEDGTALIKALLGSVTNNPNTLHMLPCWQSLELHEYMSYFKQLPLENQQAVWDKWGSPEEDPKCRQGRMMLAGMRLGETFIGIQPARGFDRDLVANYHDPDLVPPHSYLAFYFWLRHTYKVDAAIHVGKHGNLEWLPGKGSGLSNKCWPDIALGPLPHFYPFIVNDPGEGAQAKRRTQAVIIDHLMPPMTRAETYGELAVLESLVDEYYQALGLDPRREKWLKDKILHEVKSNHVLEELNSNQVDTSSTDDGILEQLDTYLCDIKEAQIRHGLHRLGELPDQEKLKDTIVSLLRLPRGQEAYAQGILHNLSLDMKLFYKSEIFDPLMTDVKSWSGGEQYELAVHAILSHFNISLKSWRTTAEVRDSLEDISSECIKRYVLGSENINNVESFMPNTFQQLQYAKSTLLPALHQSAHLEIQSILSGLNGKFVPPGPSGAPTRGRLDTLPTGRNFFSVDNRSIPTPAAWALGQKSAQALIERHLQEHGEYPSQLGLSVWGTATMRTGGDDIAQAFALMGVKPIWAAGSQRVVNFELTPTMLMQRPRVDVTLRVSGFFRDAFPNVMRLFDAAVKAIADLEEPGFGNTIRQNVLKRIEALQAEGLSHETAKQQACYRVFGSKPGAYGAGLQGLIDERCWEKKDDLASAYLNWGGYAYGQPVDKGTGKSGVSEGDGIAAHDAFQYQLSTLDVVLQNQDNREHDLLDSDDYYQFQGGMSNAVSVFKEEAPAVYHADHANPSAPKIRTLKEELNRVIRSRVLNPKWISAMQEHGYKGAFEMAASVDYLFAYDATTGLIDDYQYEKVADALIFDEKNQAFLQEHNADALEEMAERMLEAVQRNLWQEPGEHQQALQNLLLDIDQKKETRGVS